MRRAADVTDLCHDGENELTIEVSNEDTPSMYPASADFTFYGGLYRGVRPVLWSVVEQTALADAEVEYQEHKSPTIFAMFKVAQWGIGGRLDRARGVVP